MNNGSLGRPYVEHAHFLVMIFMKISILPDIYSENITYLADLYILCKNNITNNESIFAEWSSVKHDARSQRITELARFLCII